MSWFEQWFAFFEWSYGNTAVRQIDMEEAWDMHHFRFNEIKDSKLGIEVGAFQSWPPYASILEDEMLKKKEKWGHYDGERPVMWDMTYTPAVTFENSIGQRQTYSEYYGMCCFKGGSACNYVGGL